VVRVVREARIAILLLVAFVAAGSRANAQQAAPPDPAAAAASQPDAAALRAEIALLRQQLQALEQKVAALEGAGQAAPAPAPPPVTAPAPPAMPEPAPAPAAAAAPTSKVFNPDMAVIGNFVGAAGRNTVDPRPALSLDEAEVSLQAIVDPYARADFFLSGSPDGIEVEEGYLTFPTLPGGLLMKVGKMKAQFGKVNTQHPHVLPWVDEPLPMRNLLGGDEGLNDSGLSVSRLIPAGALFLEATGEVYNGANGVFTSQRRRDLTYVGRLRGYRDLSEGTNLDVGTSFSNRYHIIRVLGIGGMGAVYHAWDAELGMAVALKVIRPESSTDAAAAREMERRFKQELVLARQVTHKNVVRIHDLGEIDGIKYITMPYLEGSDLSTVLKERGKMPVPEALGIIRDVAAGLSAAHEAGIVHRDLKPANIMVLGDHAVIMDFGIARSSKLQAEAVNPLAPSQALDSLKSAGASTVVGTILGTVKYMAPEQAKGQAVDQRADIYALGLIFLDMLLGKRHSQGASAIEELKARMEAPPPLAQTIDPTIPKPIEQLIARCLQPDPEQRYATSADLVAALDRLDAKGELIPIKRTIRLPYAIAAVVLLSAMSVGVWWYQRQFIPPATHDPVSVLVADFVNTTKDPTFDATLETAMQRALEGAGFISAYDRAGIRRTLGVVPPETLDEAAGLKLAVQQGLGVVLSGRIEPEARGYRLSVRAVRAVTGEKIAEANDTAADKSKVLAAATQLAGEVRQALGDDESQTAQQFAMETQPQLLLLQKDNQV